MKNLVLFLFFVTPSISYSDTCEEQRAGIISGTRANCGPSMCDENDWCVTYHGIDMVRFGDQYQSGYSMFCSFTVTSPDLEQPIYWRGNVGWVYDCITPVSISRASNRVMNSSLLCGSIVEQENQTIGEAVPIVGADFDLYYYSGYQKGRRGDFRVSIPISEDIPREYITSFDVRVFDRQNSLVDSQHFINNASNQSYEYVWNGLDSLLNESLSADTFKVELIEVSPLGAIPIVQNLSLGHFNAKALGLGGWLPSNYVFYSSKTKELSKANGSIRSVEAMPYGLNQIYVAEIDGSKVYVFDSEGRHRFTKTGILGTTVLTFNYDSAGRLISIQEPFSRTTSFNRNILGELKSITTPYGSTTLVNVDSNGYISSITNPYSEVTQITYYGSEGLIQSFQKPGGQISTFTFDGDGNLLKDEHSGGYFFELVRNTSHSQFDISKVSPMGRIERSQGSGDTESIYKTLVSSSGKFSEYRYEKTGIYTQEDETGNALRTNRLYEEHDRFKNMSIQESTALISTMNTGSSVHILNSSSLSLSDSQDPFSISHWSMESQFNANVDSKIVTTYDPLSRKFSSATGLGKTFERSIDLYERVISTKKGTLERVDYSYTKEKMTSISQGVRVTVFGYNTSGLLESVTNPLGQTTVFLYDSAGRVTSKVLPDLRVLSVGYNANGKVVSLTPPGRPAHIFSENGNEIFSAYNPPTLIGVGIVNSTYSYNLDKQLTNIQMPSGSYIDYEYDLTTGNLQNIVTSEGVFQVITDSTTGLPSSIGMPDGTNTSMVYNGMRLSQSAVYFSVGGFIDYTPSYAGYGNLIVSDNVSSEMTSSSVLSYSYNNDEDLVTAGDISLSYDTPNGHLTGTSIGASSSKIDDFYTYNSYGEVTGYVVKRGATPVFELSFTRDALGRVIEKLQTMNSTTKNYSYQFDNSGRLEQVQLNSSIVSTYAYDTNSNRTGGVVYGTSTAGVYDDQDRLNSYNVYDFTYNANGELQTKVNTLLSTATSYIYDVFGNLKEVTLPSADIIAYEVDGLNRRIGKKLNGVLQKRWVYMDQLRIAGELDASGNISKRFVYASKQNIPDYMIYGGENYRIISDHLGSLRLVIKVSDGTIIQRMDHDEFGRVIEDTNPGFLPFGFAGGLYDHQTGLVRFGARDYDPEIGRWTSKDPILFNGGDTNLFGYVQNDPVNFIDPSGLRSLDPVRGCPDGNCGGSLRDEYLGRTQISISQAQNNDRIVRNIGLVGAAALTSPVTVPLAINACLSNPTACTTAGASFLTGVLEGATGEQTGFPPNDLQDAIFGGIGRGIGECLRGQ